MPDLHGSSRLTSVTWQVASDGEGHAVSALLAGAFEVLTVTVLSKRLKKHVSSCSPLLLHGSIGEPAR